MKKLLLFITLFFPFLLEAECDYKSEKELSELSVYIDYSYEYNEEKNNFDVTITNLQNLFSVNYNNKKYDINSKITINNIELGENIQIDIKGSVYSNCPNQSFRTLSISLPYLNPYHNSEKCKGYESLSVCYSKFLNFKISSETFKNALKREQEEQKTEESKIDKILENIFSFIKTNYIKILLVLVTSTIWFIIYKNKYRKSKHGF